MAQTIISAAKLSMMPYNTLVYTAPRWSIRSQPSFQPAFPSLPYSHHPAVLDIRFLQPPFLHQAGNTHLDVPVTQYACSLHPPTIPYVQVASRKLEWNPPAPCPPGAPAACPPRARRHRLPACRDLSPAPTPAPARGHQRPAQRRARSLQRADPFQHRLAEPLQRRRPGAAPPGEQHLCGASSIRQEHGGANRQGKGQ